jgi:aldehyde dehydrogenase
MRYAHPGTPGALVSFKSAYGNFIDGKFVEPLGGEFFMNTSPVDGSNIAQFPALMPKISTSPLMPRTGPPKPGENVGQQRSNLLLQVADRIEATWNIWRWRRAGTTVNRSAKP